MKKHILGFTLFNFIVVSFGLIYAFLNVPAIPTLPKVEEVKNPVYRVSERSSCRQKMRSAANLFSSEIVSSNYYAGEHRIVTKIRVNLDETAGPIEKIYVSGEYAAGDELKKVSFSTVQFVGSRFASGNVREVTVVSELSGKEKFKPRENLFVSANVTDDKGNHYPAFGDYKAKKEVLTVY